MADSALEALLAAGKKKDWKAYKESLAAPALTLAVVNAVPTGHKYGLIHHLASWGALDALKATLSRFPELDLVLPTSTGQTPIQVAQQKKKQAFVDYVRSLQGASASVETKDPERDSVNFHGQIADIGPLLVRAQTAPAQTAAQAAAQTVAQRTPAQIAAQTAPAQTAAQTTPVAALAPVQQRAQASGGRHRYLILQTIELATLPKAHWFERTSVHFRLTYSPRPGWSYATNNKEPGKKTMAAFDIHHPFRLEENTEVLTATLVDHLCGESLGAISFKVSDVLPHCDHEGRAVIRGKMTLGNPQDPKSKAKEQATSFVATFRTENWDPVYSEAKGEENEVKLDWWSKLTVKAIALQLDQAVIIDAGSLPLPPEPSDIEMTTVAGMTVKVAANDPHLSAPAGSGPILKFFNELKFDDDPGYFPSRSVGLAWLTKVTENLWPDPKEGLWRDVTSDDNFRQYCFCNAGADFIKRVDGKYVVDLDAIMDYPEFPVRDKWEVYGGKAHFNEKGCPDRIELKVNGVTETHRPGEQHWEYAKLRIRSGLFIVASGFHLCSAHLRWANEPQIGTRRYLDSIHPINRLIAPHFYRSALVIAKSLNSLTPERGMLHRSTAFTAKGLQNFFQRCYDTFEFMPWIEVAKKRGWGDDCDDSIYPSYRDARDLAAVIDKYVGNYVKIYYESEQDVLQDEQLRTYWNYMQSVWNTLPNLSRQTLIDFCSNVIFYNSAWHEQVGNVSGYSRDPCGISLLIKKGERTVLGTPESNLLVAYITVMTQQRTPRLIGDWTHYFLDERAKRIYHAFHEDLSQHSVEVNKRNASRDFPVLDYDPTYVKMSVSS